MMIMMTRFNFSFLCIDIFSKSFISEALANENKMTKLCPYILSIIKRPVPSDSVEGVHPVMCQVFCWQVMTF